MTVDSKLAELLSNGFCVLRGHFPLPLIDACREAFWPVLLKHLQDQEPNRGPHRYFTPMPFHPPCFAPELFFDAGVLQIVRATLGDRITADQWSCDTPLQGSEYQTAHVDYQRPLFPEMADLVLPPYMLVVSFGLVQVTLAHGPIEIAPGTHKLPREAAMSAVQSGHIQWQPVPLELGDVLIRHPWAVHRGTPNKTGTPRALATIRYVRHWYADNSREVNAIPAEVWRSLTPEQQPILRFPLA